MKVFVCVLLLCIAQYTYCAPAVNELTAAEQARIFAFLTDVWNGLIVEPVNHISGSLAGMLAQLGLGILENEGILVGKRSVENDAKIFDFLTSFSNQLYDALYPHINTAVQAGALTITQMLANFANGNANGLRSVESDAKIFDFLTSFGNQLYDALYPHINTAVQAGALTITQMLANFANGNANGKRNLENEARIFDFLTSFGNQLYDALYPHINTAVQSGALTITQMLANFANGNANGRRSVESDAKIFDFLTSFGNQLYDSLYPHINNAVQAGALTITQMLANFANGNANGRRSPVNSEEQARWLAALVSDMKDKIKDQINSLATSAALPITSWLINVANEGLLTPIGKRGL